MKVVKPAVKILLWITLVAIVVLIAYALVPPAPYEAPPRNVRNETQFNLDEKVGWYSLSDSTMRMVTWGAENGLTVNRFDQPGRSVLTPVSRESFTWRFGQNEIPVSFSLTEGGEVSGFSWDDPSGKHFSAERLVTFGYSQQEVRYRSEGIQLTGLLMLPVDIEIMAAVVFIHGSGVSDRDNYWYLYQADFLARRGVAVLLPDKRGCGKSEGEWHTAGFEDFARDALAGVTFIQSVESLNPGKIGLLGISQGGWIAPLAASQSSAVNFVINVSGTVTTPNEQISHEISAGIRGKGVPGFVVDGLAPFFKQRAQQRREIWWEKNGDFDPIPYWRELSVPALIVYGQKDEEDNVPVSESLKRLEALKLERSNLPLIVEVFEDSGHALEDPETGWTRHDYLEFLVDWIHRASSSH